MKKRLIIQCTIFTYLTVTSWIKFQMFGFAVNISKQLKGTQATVRPALWCLGL